MSEDEARLRVQLARKRGLLVRQYVQDIQNLSKGTTAPSKREFITPLSSKLSLNRWQSFANSVAKQIYGVKQEVIVLKRKIKLDSLDISIIRLFSSVGLTLQNLLQGLLQFPEEVTKSLRTESAGVIHDVIKTAEEFLSLLSNLQILDDEENVPSESMSESNISLVESEVVEELQKRGEMTQRIAQLAAIRLNEGVKGDGEGSTTQDLGNVLLPDGRRMKLVQDTLSYRLGSTKPVIVETESSEPVIEQRDGNRLPTRKNYRHRFNFNANRQQSEVDSKQRPPLQKNAMRRQGEAHSRRQVEYSRRQAEAHSRRYRTPTISSKKPKGRRRTEVVARLESEESSWCSEEEDEHELMRQLMSLLSQQETSSPSTDHEKAFHSALVKVEALLNRLEEMEERQKNTEEEEEQTYEDELNDTMEKAREALASLNFAECSEELKGDSEETSPCPSSPDCLLKEIIRNKEVFWANMASDETE